MKIKDSTVLPDGRVKVIICNCEGKSKCKPEDRPVKTFKSESTFTRWKNAFRIKSV